MKRILPLLLSILLGPAAAQAAPARPVVVELRGQLKAAGKTLAQGDLLAFGTPVTLAAGGKAVIRIEEGVILLKGPASFTPKARGLDLRSGGILSVLRSLKRPWRIRTTAAVASVRGTEFYMEARPDGATYLCLCEGALHVSSPRKSSASGVRLKTESHAAYSFQDEAGRMTTAPASREGHEDAELAELRALLQK